MTEEMNKVIDNLEKYGKEIGEMSNTCELSSAVMTYYRMWHRCPSDNGSYVFTKIKLNEWIAKYKTGK